MFLLYLVVISILTPVYGVEINSENPWADNYIEARKTAVDLNRPYIIFFTADDCSACEIQRNIFSKPGIQSIMKQSFVALDVSIRDFDGATLRKYYEVDDLPTLIFFSPTGDILYRYDRILSEDQLTRALLRPKENVFQDSNVPGSSIEKSAHIQVGVFSREKGAKDLQQRLTRICSIRPDLIQEDALFKVVFPSLKSEEIERLKTQLDTYGYTYNLIEDQLRFNKNL